MTNREKALEEALRETQAFLDRFLDDHGLRNPACYLKNAAALSLPATSTETAGLTEDDVRGTAAIIRSALSRQRLGLKGIDTLERLAVAALQPPAPSIKPEGWLTEERLHKYAVDYMAAGMAGNEQAALRCMEFEHDLLALHALQQGGGR